MMLEGLERDIVQDWVDTYGIDYCGEQIARFKKIQCGNPNLWSFLKPLMRIAMTGNSNRLIQEQKVKKDVN